MIHYEDGTIAQIAGRFLTWPGGHAALSDITVTPLGTALAMDVSAIKPPVMYAAITVAEQTGNAAMPLAEYQLLAINSARATGALATGSALHHRSVKFVAPMLAKAGQAARRVCGSCGKR